MIPRVFGARPEDSTFWLLLPGSGPKCEAITGAWQLTSQFPPSRVRKNSEVCGMGAVPGAPEPQRRPHGRHGISLRRPEILAGGNPASGALAVALLAPAQSVPSSCLLTCSESIIQKGPQDP